VGDFKSSIQVNEKEREKAYDQRKKGLNSNMNEKKLKVGLNKKPLATF